MRHNVTMPRHADRTLAEQLADMRRKWRVAGARRAIHKERSAIQRREWRKRRTIGCCQSCESRAERVTHNLESTTFVK